MTPDYFSPDNVLVVTFGEDPENDKNAYQALTDLKQLDSQDQIKITGAAVVTRDGDGRVDVKSDVGEDPYVGTASGGLIGLLDRDHRRPARHADRRGVRNARRIAVRHR